MLDHDLDPDTLAAARVPHLTVPPASAPGPDDRFDPDRCLTSVAFQENLKKEKPLVPSPLMGEG